MILANLPSKHDLRAADAYCRLLHHREQLEASIAADPETAGELRECLVWIELELIDRHEELSRLGIFRRVMGR